MELDPLSRRLHSMPRLNFPHTLVAPITLMVVAGCNTPITPGTTPIQEVAVAGVPPVVQVVSVEDSLPKPPRYSPYVIDHGTLSPYSSPLPDPTAKASAAPTAGPSPTPGPSPTTSATPSAPVSTPPTPKTSVDPGPALNYSGTYSVALLAGGTTGAAVDGTGAAAVLGQTGVTVGLAVTTASNSLGFADAGANWMRLVSLPGAVFTKLLGDPAGTPTPSDTSLNQPGGAAYDAGQNLFYVADTNNNRIFRVSPTGGAGATVVGPPTLAAVQQTPTFANGSGSGGTTLATLFAPRGLALNSAKKLLYVADSKFHMIRQVDVSVSPAIVSSLAGTSGVSGSQTAATEAAGTTKFDTPEAIALSVDGKTLYVADTNNNVVRAIDVSGATAGNVTILAGTGTLGATDGPTGTATFSKPCALALDATHLYVGEQLTPRLRVIDLTTGTVTTALGTLATGQVVGDKSKAQFIAIKGLATSLDASNKAVSIFAYDTGDMTAGSAKGARLLQITP
jgi:sugar lactone lactonase YvrE